MKHIGFGLSFLLLTMSSSVGALAAVAIPLTVNLSETVTVTGTPQISVDVGGVTRVATYTSGTGTNALTFTLSPQAGDVDLDGISISSPIDLNGGTIKDAKGNDATLTFTPPNTANVKVNYPSLGMDFVYDADGRYTLNGTAYNDLTSFLTATGGSFTRATIGTYFDSSGILQTAASGVPRFDYDPVTHAQKGILIEEQRTNYLTYSQSHDNAVWTKVAATVAGDATVAPDSTMTADKIIAAATSALHYVDSPAVSLVSGNTYMYSIFAKAAEWPILQIALPVSGYGSNAWANFNLSAGVIGNKGASAVATIQSVGAGWYRISLKGVSGTTNTLKFAIVPLPSDMAFRAPTYTGDATSGVYVWGAQVEQGTFLTSYIPTIAATVTRVSDSFSFPTNSWFSASGTLFSQASVPYLGSVSARPFMALDDGTSTNLLHVRINDSAADKVGYGMAIAGVSTGYDITASAYVPSTIAKVSVGYQNNNVNGAVNGVLGTLNTSISLPNFIRLRVGTSLLATPLNGWIEKAIYYPHRVTDAQLLLLTQ